MQWPFWSLFCHIMSNDFLFPRRIFQCYSKSFRKLSVTLWLWQWSQKSMKIQQAEVGVWDQYDTQWKSEVQGGLYPDDGDKGRLLFSYRIALEQYLKKVLFYNLTIISRAAALRCHIAKERGWCRPPVCRPHNCGQGVTMLWRKDSTTSSSSLLS